MPGTGVARGPRPAPPGPVGEHHEDGLGGADPVEDLHAEALAPRRGRSPAGAAPRPRRRGAPSESVRGQVGAEQPRVERRHREEERGLLARDRGRHRRGIGPARAQARGGAGAGRESAARCPGHRRRRASRWRRSRSRGGHAEHVHAVVATGEQVAVAGARPPSASPSCPTCRARRPSRRRRPAPARAPSATARAATRARAIPPPAARPRPGAAGASEGGRERPQDGRVADHHRGPAVAHESRQRRGIQARVQGDRDRADAERAEEERGPLRTVWQRERHALLRLDTQRAQRVPGPARERRESA